jgi:hypoxia up-regulated 1
MGAANISQIQVQGVKEVFAKHEGQETKGIKVHFRLDESGLLRLDKVDVTFEKSAKELEAEESTLSSMSLNIFLFYMLSFS